MNFKSISLSALLMLVHVLGFGQKLTDASATLTTCNLYKNLMNISGKDVLFGHQDDMAYGVGWKYIAGRSDVKDLTGQYPAVLGWDVAGLEKGSSVNLDGIPFDNMKRYLKKAYDIGAVNTISWHMDNPLNGKNAWDTTSNSVKSVLPGQKKHQLYLQWLNKFAIFANSLKGSDGKLIPLLFRPFHEHSGGWFWWGKKSCTPEEYKALWRFTVTYLRDKKKIHHLIYVFNPCDFENEAQYLERYPGDDFVDILSFDSYQYGGAEKNDAYKADIAKKLAIQAGIAKAKNKVAAIAEMGFVEIPDPNWWTDVFAQSIAQNKPAYVLFWRNAGYRPQEKDNHYYVPYPGQTSATNFIQLLKEQKVLLQNGAKTYHLYQ